MLLASVCENIEYRLSVFWRLAHPILIIDGQRRFMRSLYLAMLLTCFVAATARGEQADDHADLPPTNSVEPIVAATGLEVASGVAVDEEFNVFAPNYRSLGGIGQIKQDGTASLLCRLDKLAPVEGRTPFAQSLRLDTQRRLIVADAGGGRLLRVEVDGSRADVLSDRYQGVRLREVSHVALDRAGNIYFTERPSDTKPSDEAASEATGRLFVYRIRTQKTELLAGGMDRPSGIAVSPDQKKLCVAEQGTRRVLIFDIEDIQIARRRELIRFPMQSDGNFAAGDFAPKGLAFDRRGRLYVCMGAGGMINVVETPSGRLLRRYKTLGSVSDCHFADTTLYIAIESKEAVFRLPLGVEGFVYSK